jgi:UDP-glucose 4-epimerase
MKKNISQIKHAIVTGASGFIGSALTENLVSKGVEVIAIDIAPRLKTDCMSVLLDVTEKNAMDKYIRSDTVIFHMAARASVPGSVADPADDFHNTCYGLFQVLESARKYGCRVIFPSTASIFDVGNELPVTERSYVKPSSPYGAAKVAGEAYCFVYHRCYGIDIRIARMFSVYGVGMNRFAIHDIIKKILRNNEELLLLGDGGQVRDYLYVEDVINGLERIATNGKPGEDYNLASGQKVPLLELARTIACLMDVPDIKISVTGESFPGDIPQWFGDITKIKDIGFVPMVSLRDGLERTINWLKCTEGS